MMEIEVAKVTINIGVGEAGEKILKAEKVLEMITKQKPVRTYSKTTNKDLGIRKDQEIGCKVTLRGAKAEEFLTQAFWVRENRIFKYSFDREGNFSFGIPDYTDFKGMKYDPDIGIFGMDISAQLKRKGGTRVKTRRIMKRHIPSKHRITHNEGVEFAKDRFQLEVLE
ncbi:MAG: 50S ribosomal protein L5 [Candidatus Thermoplasmatota archaeon]|nr:50S ribosomal protein L5 [Candidatus Thermoplasmatota archaeon]